jgi:hypothetical protein
MYVWVLQHSNGSVHRLEIPEEYQTDNDQVESILELMFDINNCDWMISDNHELFQGELNAQSMELV